MKYIKASKIWYGEFLHLKFFVLISCMAIAFHTPCWAQEDAKSDSVSLMRTFLSVCNSYKRPPFHLSLNYSVKNNFVSDPADTTSLSAEFYFTSRDAYIKFGEVEQILQDTIALMVSHSAQRMIISSDISSIRNKMNIMSGSLFPEKSIGQLLNKYSIRQFKSNKLTNFLELQSKLILPGTQLARETIRLEYNQQKNIPLQVLQTKRSLLSLEQSEYDTLSRQSNLSGSLLMIGSKFYFLKIEETSYLYNIIEYGDELAIPVQLKDRIKPSGPRRFLPVASYANFTITDN